MNLDRYDVENQNPTRIPETMIIEIIPNTHLLMVPSYDTQE
jgi:hypothetical protein